jgi:flagellar secretion chaperone FliS
MNKTQARTALQQYENVGVDATANAAMPHQLIEMLLGGALDRIATAKGQIERGDLAGKGGAIGRAIGIVAGLRKSLNHEGGGEIATNLELIYDYVERRLLEANRNNDVAILNEAARLLGNVKAGWDGIPPEVAAAFQRT